MEFKAILILALALFVVAEARFLRRGDRNGGRPRPTGPPPPPPPTEGSDADYDYGNYEGLAELWELCNNVERDTSEPFLYDLCDLFNDYEAGMPDVDMSEGNPEGSGQPGEGSNDEDSTDATGVDARGKGKGPKGGNNGNKGGERPEGDGLGGGSGSGSGERPAGPEGTTGGPQPEGATGVAARAKGNGPKGGKKDGGRPGGDGSGSGSGSGSGERPAGPEGTTGGPQPAGDKRNLKELLMALKRMLNK